MRPIRALLFAVLSAVLASAIVYFAVVRPRVRDWGFDPLEAELPMPGDDLIPEPSATETRGITIDAPPDKVWPWLVQMGYQRGGWYSYDALDTRHPPADRILPEFQSLKVGDTVPYGPGSGFRVEAVDPERELVLYVDADLARHQAEQAVAEGVLPEEVSRASYPEFSASWAFSLKPIGDDKTRLIERFRARTPGAGPVKAVMGEIMGTGLVLMGRKQMIGIKERVERLAYEVPAAASNTESTEATESAFIS
jgi:proline iminopeptidase